MTLLHQISEDRALGSALLFSHRHKQASPAFHVQLTDLWRSADEFVVIEAFRQGAKTTLSEEFLLMEALFMNFKYCLIFGETYTKACQRIEGMKHELMTNQKIRQLFGKQDGHGKWAENKIVLANGVAIEAHGWEEEIRGYLHFDARPDRAYLDDIETEERVRDTATVDKNWRKLYKQLIPAMDKDARKIRMTGTPLADDSMIRRAAIAKDWVHGKFPICNGDIDSPDTLALWDARYPMDWIRSERDRFAQQGMLREFMQEFMLVPTGAQGKPFTEDMLKFDDLAPTTYSPRVVILDPARTVEVKKSDQTGMVVVSRVGTRIFVHESGGFYAQPDEIVNLAFDTSRKHDDAEVVIEKNSLDDWLLQPMRAKMLSTGNSLKLKPVNAPQDRDKAAFIMGLRSFFLSGDIVLVGGRGAHQQLVSQILNFPSGKRDIINALAYSLRVFSGQAIYPDFSSANITSEFIVPRNAQLLLAVNSNSSETTAALCAIDGRYITVIADWVSPLMPNDAIPDIAMLIRAIYPGKTVSAWIPADVYDQVGRNPVISALKSAGMKANRAENAIMSRGGLSPVIRTEMRGRRMFLVDSNARNSLQALSSGYNWPVKSDGQRAGEPERGTARTLMEGLECLVTAIEKSGSDNALISPNANNASGARYYSAIGTR